jgi:signal transduction histidine kinase
MSGHLARLLRSAQAAVRGLRFRTGFRKTGHDQAGLRWIAELVAKGAPQQDLFAAVAAEASRLIKQETTLLRVENDGTYSVVAVCGSPATIGTRLTVAADDDGLIPEIIRTRRPARLDDYAARPGRAYARDDYGVRSGVGAPIVVDDRLWGILGATSNGRKLPADSEQRLAEFAGLVAAALANVQARADIQQLADEQSALRAVAELVAQAVPPEDIFAAVTVEASRLLAGAPMTLTRFGHDSHLVVLATHRGPAPIGTRIDYEAGTLPDRARRDGTAVRVDDYSVEPDAQLAVEFNLAAAVSVPIIVGGEVWGMLTATSDAHPLAAGAEQRLLQFTGLITAALANIQTRMELQSLADEQAALRSVAELAAQGAPAEQVLGAVATQASRLTGVDFSTLLRYEPDGSTEIVALDGAPPGVAVGMRAPGSGDGSVQRVWRTHQPARVDNLAAMSGRWPQVAQGHGFSTSAAVPILTHGTLWGSLVVVGRDKPLPAEIHVHLTSFAELCGTAIAAAHSRRQLQQIADEQGALRRVAELVARGAALPEVFTAVAVEASQLLGDLAAALLRHEESTAVVVATCNSPVPIGLRFPPTPGSSNGEVLRTGKPWRIDDVGDSPLVEVAVEHDVAAVVIVPIIVEGRVWGTLSISSPDAPLPVGIEDRLTPFAELAAAAIANAENKQKLTASRARVVATADETRRRLQRDVHDSAQQRLVHTIIILKLARDAIATGANAAELVDEALTNAQRANRDLRDVVHGILPESLTRGGLQMGLESLVAGFSLPTRLRTAVPRLPADIETTAYFIVAEALANVVKHAQARNTAIELALDGDHLDVQITDDGVGGANPGHGSGLTGLLDRVEASNGSLVLTSPAGKGTTLHARLPIQQRS